MKVIDEVSKDPPYRANLPSSDVELLCSELCGHLGRKTDGGENGVSLSTCPLLQLALCARVSAAAYHAGDTPEPLRTWRAPWTSMSRMQHLPLAATSRTAATDVP